MNTRAQKTVEDGNEDQLRTRIEALEKELERERGKYNLETQTLKARMREIKKKAQRETFEFKCKYEDLLKETEVRQQTTQSEDISDTIIDRRKEAESSDDGNHSGRKESWSNISEKAIQTDEGDITIRYERIREPDDRVSGDDVPKGDSQNVQDFDRSNTAFKESNRALLTLKQCIERIEDERKRLQNELQTCEKKNKQLTESIGRAKSEKAILEQENQRLKEEIEKLRLRFSEVAGSLMLDRNPSIADLSDATRPTKLVEIFSELYDNQFTDAFQELEGSEKDAIQQLLNILTRIHRVCQRVASEYIHELEQKTITWSRSGRAIFKETTEIPAATRKFILEIRKSVSEHIIRELLMYFRDKIVENEENIGKQRDGTTKYVEKCIEVCWYMAIKDPPVVLGDIPTEGDPINTDLFKFYTCSGKYVEYCVWPPLFLFKGGALLRKGIVQGK